MLHHTMTHRSGIVVLISGDIDFAETVHDLVHTGGYKVVLIHNKQARQELCRNASKALLFKDVVTEPKGANHSNAAKSNAKKADVKVPKDANSSPRKKDSGQKVKHPVPEKPTKQQQKQQHQKKTAKEWNCNGCSKKFSSEDTRDKQVEATGHDIQWTCDECSRQFQTAKALEQHQESTGHDQIACSECFAVPRAAPGCYRAWRKSRLDLSALWQGR